MRDIDKQARKNAFLYCTFRDKQFALYDAFAKEKGMTMNTLLVVNALFYAKDGLTQSEICATVHHSKQTVSLIVKRLLAEGRHITTSEDAAMALLSPEEQEVLVALSRRFTQNLAALVNGEDERQMPKSGSRKGAPA